MLNFFGLFAYFLADPVLKEAAANAGPNSMPSLPSSGGTTPMGVSTPAEGEQEMSEPVQLNTGSQ